jgi:NADH pyrophosphatase NudC (nudix superfamily)
MASEVRLIDANALKAEFTGNFHEMWHYTGIRAMIDVAPTVETVVVVHGRWITDGDGVTYCGKCRHIDDYASVHNYCPNCGAKMDGDGHG